MTFCYGQVEGIEPSGKKKNQGRPVKVMYYMAPRGAPVEAYVYAGATQVGVTELTRTNFSETFEIPKGGRIGAKGKAGGPVKLSFLPSSLSEGEELPAGAPSVIIPKNWQKVLLLVFPNPKNSVMPIRFKAINASEDKFGAGSIYMLNYSDVGVFGTVGDKTLKLNPRSEKIIKDPINKNGTYPVKLESQVKGEKKPRRFIKQMWGHSDKMRSVLFIMPKPAPMHATYYNAPIRDF